MIRQSVGAGTVEIEYRRARIDLPVGMPAIATARHVARTVLTGWGFTDPLWLDEAEVIIAELVSNVVQHVGGPSSLELEADLAEVTVTVADTGSRLAAPRSPDATGGRGLWIVGTLAAEHGSRRRAGGKEVWVRLAPHRPTVAQQRRNGSDQGSGVSVEFRPLVDLATGDTVGHVATARSRSAQLSWRFRAGVLRAAIDAGLPAGAPLIVDSGPPAMNDRPADLRTLVSAGQPPPTALLTVSTHPVITDLGDLLGHVRRARDSGWGIDLRIGPDPRALAIMPLVRPDVITVELSQLRICPPLVAARIAEAVRGQAERTGALVVAAGVTSEGDRDTARALGAGLGHGPLFGPPRPLPPPPTVTRSLPTLPPAGDPAGTPFDLVAAHRPVTRAAKHLLLPTSMHIEHAGLDHDEPIVVLGCFQHARNFTGETRLRFTDIAGSAAFVAALGDGMPGNPAPGVYGGRLDADDPLCREWNVIALGPRSATALVSRDCGDTGPDRERRFDYTVTHDRALVVQAAEAILAAWTATREGAVATASAHDRPW